MNSCECLLDPKNIFMCVVLVWSFGDECFCEWIYNYFFGNLQLLAHFFTLQIC
jgi:hypothetical protein